MNKRAFIIILFVFISFAAMLSAQAEQSARQKELDKQMQSMHELLDKFDKVTPEQQLAAKKQRVQLHEDYQRNFALWRSQNIHSYSMTVEIRCFCDNKGPIVVKVRNGNIVAARYARLDAAEEYGAAKLQDSRTIDAYFSQLQQSINHFGAHSVLKVEYDSRYGFPSYMYFDIREANDAGKTIRINDFELVKDTH